MTVLYNLSIVLYVLLIRIVSPFHKKAKQWLEGRKHIFERLQESFNGNTRPVAWFHVASLGEFEQARPVIEAFRAAYPDYRILLTFFSPSGYELRKTYPGADDIFYLPSDTRNNAQRFLSITSPNIVFFVKYEFWFHYLDELRIRRIHTILFSAIFRKSQPFFSRHTDFYRNILSCFSFIFVQDDHSVSLLKNIAVTNVKNAGDTRFDRVLQLTENRKDIPLAKAFKDDSKVFIAGSVWDADMNVLIPLLNDPAFQELKIIIAPHEIHEEEIRRWQEKINRKSVLYSEANEQTIQEQGVLFINNIGLLSSLYQYAEFAWIGGAYGKGLHNILEAATYGMPVFFGTRYQKFREARELISAGAAFSVANTEELTGILLPIKNDDHKRNVLAHTARSYVQQNTGATETLMNYLSEHLNKTDRK